MATEKSHQSQADCMGASLHQELENSNSGIILFYDGECGLCDHFVTFCLKRDHYQSIRYAPLQGSTAHIKLPENLTKEIKTVVCLENGKVTTHSSAVIRILWKLGGLWSCLGTTIYFIPPVIRNLGYKIIARYRILIMGRKETCRIPTPSERLRFLP